MKTKIAFVVVLASAVVAVTTLWLRVRALETSVDRLTQQVLAAPHIQSIATRPSEPDSATDQKRNPFKLIEVSNVGVPWSVEHAMLSDGREHPATR
ncbi:MAG TPA: hypothetical protein VGM76_05110 [Lacipirellulaceae bacterium]|jgi:hypothetical protein